MFKPKLLSILFLIFLWAPAAHAARHALLIGNSEYASDDFDDLNQPGNDVKALARVLPDYGFRVYLHENLDYSGMLDAKSAFEDKLHPGDVALFYYAGHAIQVDNDNWLIPVRDDHVIEQQPNGRRKFIKERTLTAYNFT